MKTSLVAATRAGVATFFRNRVLRNSAYSVSTLLLPAVLLLLFTPALVRQMGVEAYGLWTLVLTALGLMGTLELGLSAAISKYVAEHAGAGDDEGISATITAGMALQCALGVLLTVPLYWLAPQFAGLFSTATLPTSEVVSALQWTSLALLPVLIRSGCLAVPAGLQRFELPAIFNVVHRVLILVAALLISVSTGSVPAVILSTILLTWLAGLASVAAMLISLRGMAVKPLFRWRQTRPMLSFAVYNGAATIGSQIFSSVDRFAVGAVLGMSAVAYYSVVIGIANKSLYVSDYAARALMPAASAWHAAGDRASLRRYFWRGSKLFLMFNGAAGIALALLARPFMTAWMGPDFAAQSADALAILAIVYAGISFNSVAFHMVNGMGKPWICAVTQIAGGLGTVWLIGVLGERMGLAGAAWANAAYWITALITIYVARLIGKPVAEGDKPVQPAAEGL
jgi:O-antigen/teichoic acid export membrane protein